MLPRRALLAEQKEPARLAAGGAGRAVASRAAPCGPLRPSARHAGAFGSHHVLRMPRFGASALPFVSVLGQPGATLALSRSGRGAGRGGPRRGGRLFGGASRSCLSAGAARQGRGWAPCGGGAAWRGADPGGVADDWRHLYPCCTPRVWSGPSHISVVCCCGQAEPVGEDPEGESRCGADALLFAYFTIGIGLNVWFTRLVDPFVAAGQLVR